MLPLSLGLSVGPGGLTAVLFSESHLHSSQLSCLSFLDSSLPLGHKGAHPTTLVPWGLAAQILTEIYLLCAELSLGSSKGQDEDCPLLSASPNPSAVFLFPDTTSQAVRRGQRAQVSFLRELPASDFYHCLPTQPGLFPSFQSRRLSSWLKSGETCSDTCIRIFDVIIVVFCALRVPSRPERFFSLSNLRLFSKK